MKFGTTNGFIVLLLLLSFTNKACEEKAFVIIIPTYNNERDIVEKNLISVFEQDYKDYRTIIIDDCSSNQTYSWCREIISHYHQESRVTLVRNEERCGALANTYAAIHSCADNEIWIVLDGDDWFSGSKALKTFNKYYNDRGAWASFGQYIAWPTGEIGHAEAFPEDVIRTNTLRKYRLPSKRAFLPITAPRTGYVWLFKLIKLQDLLADDGYFYLAAGDYAYMIPVLELGGMRGIFIPDILYVYNIRNPIADARVNAKIQARNAIHILHSNPYLPVCEPIVVETVNNNDAATLFIFCSNNPETLMQTLDSIVKLIKPLANIKIMYHPDQAHQASFQYLMSSFPGVVWIKCDVGKFHLCMQEQLSLCVSNYVFLASDEMMIDKAIDVTDGIRAMKKTHTQLLFYGIGQNERECFIQSRLAPIDMAHNRYGLFSDNVNNKNQLPVLSCTMFSKDLLSALVDSISTVYSFEEFSIALSDLCKKSNILSVVGKYAIVHARDSR